MAEESQKKEPVKKQISRRDLLKAAVVGTSTALVEGTLLSGTIEKALINTALNFFADPKNGSQILDSAAHLLGNEKDNPDFRPVDELIADGKKDYQNNGRNKVFFKKDPEYKDYSYYKQKIEEISRSIGVLPTTPHDLSVVLTDSFSSNLKRVYNSSFHPINGEYLGLMNKGSGMYKRFGEEFPQYAGLPRTNQDIIDKTREKAKEYVLEAKTFMEEEALKNGGPVSASLLFSFFLGKNNGNISESLIDTSVFLKFAARNNSDNGYFVANNDNLEWMKRNVKDEYGAKSYNDSGDINEVGEPYHTWNLAAMLVYFPPEMVQIAGVYEQIDFITSQGINKLETDMVTLAALNKVESVLLKYA